MTVVGGKFTDNEFSSSSEIGWIEVIIDPFEKELEKNIEFEDKMEQADTWMGRSMKGLRLMTD